jgi:hypothetical protein
MNGLTYKHINAERNELQDKLDKIEKVVEEMQSYYSGEDICNEIKQILEE